MPANIEFPLFVSETVLFHNREGANAFFSNILIPDATTTEFGVMKQASSLTFTPSSYANVDTVFFAVVGGTNVTIPTSAHMDAVKARLEATETALNSLLTRLRNAGIIANP